MKKEYAQEEMLVLVDEDDNQIDTGPKMQVHLQGKLHRAFSIFIYNKKGELLIQKRADMKYHSAGLWANSCCGHPRLNEENIIAAKRRLYEELGFSCDLSKITEICYNLPLENGLYEHEYTHIFAGVYDGHMEPNTEEVSAIKWINPQDLINDFKVNQQNYARWFALYIEKYYIDSQLDLKPIYHLFNPKQDQEEV